MSADHTGFTLQHLGPTRCAQLVAHQDFDPTAVPTETRLAVTNVLLHEDKGWLGVPLDFLAELPNLTSLSVRTSKNISLTPIAALTGLQEMYLECPKCSHSVDLSALPRLRFLRLKRSPALEAPILAPQLEVLYLVGSTQSSLLGHRLDNLRDLRIYQSRKLTSLNGLSRFAELQQLFLYSCPNLSDVSELKISRLSRIDIAACRGIHMLFENLPHASLAHLVIENSGKISSLSMLPQFTKLREFRLIDTSVEDGDLGPTLLVPECRVTFTNYAHYSHWLRYDRSVGKALIKART